MKYTRIYGDSNGETHFEDVEEETQQTEIAPTVSDGEVRRFGPGDVVLIDDLASKGHKSVAVGGSDCEIIYVGLAE